MIVCCSCQCSAAAKLNHAVIQCAKPIHIEVLYAHYTHSFISTAPRTAVSASSTAVTVSGRRPTASSQMERFRQACDAQYRRPLWQLQQANYGGCVFAVRFRSSLVSAIAPRHCCSMLPEQHALAHP
jgi:hypothetical protein